MPEIRAFKAWTYSSKFKNQLSSLLSPPYDVLSSADFKTMCETHPHQSVQLALAKNPDDPYRYEAMASLFRAWKDEGVLAQVEQPSFYLVEEIFEDAGRKQSRIGFVGLVKTGSYEEKQIVPHEHTLAGPKKDRYDLLHTIKAEISQVFLGYKDPEDVVGTIYRQRCVEEPYLVATDFSGVARRVWLLSDGATVNAVAALLQQRSALICDGHHRYETALASQDLCPWAAAYFTNLDQPGFEIRPIHRIFSLPPEHSSDNFLEKLRSAYHVEEVDRLPESSVRLSSTTKTSDKLELHLALRNKIFRLSRPKGGPEDAEIFSIHRDIFETILGWNIQELKKGLITYANTTPEFVSAVQAPDKVGLFLPPTDLSLVMNLAARSHRMPQKSTFFFPKIASGLIIFDLTNY